MSATPLTLVPDPDANRYAELGITDPALGRLLHVALSRLLGRYRGERAFVRNVGYVFAAVGRLAFRRSDGALEAAPAPQLPEFGWTDGRDVMVRLNMTPAELDRMWARAEAVDGVHAALPLDGLVLEFVPAELLPLLAQVIAWGPAETVQRLERVVRQEANRAPQAGARRGAGGRLSAATIEKVISEPRRFLHVLTDLADMGYPSPLLEAWRVKLPRPLTPEDVDADTSTTDRSAPQLLTVRRYLRRVDAEITTLRRTAAGEARIGTRLRNRLLIGLLAALGARIGAIARLLVEHYDRSHRFPDGEVGPALLLFPAKTIATGEGRWKALPPELASWLDEYLAHRGITAGPIFPRSRAGDGRHMRASHLGNVLAGDRSVGPPQPLIPRDDDSTGGYSPQSLRHLAEQLAYAAGADYLEAVSAAARTITPQVFADALLDHVMDADRLGYKDLTSNEGRERWARRASLGVWEYVWGGRGARKAPDVAAITAAHDALAEIAAERSAIELRVDELRRRRRELERAGDKDSLAVDELVRVVFQLSALGGALEDEHDELARVQARSQAAERSLVEARSRLVPLPDELDEQPALPDELDLAGGLEAEPAPVRDWLTVPEAAHAFGVSEPTMRRWFRGELPHAAGDPRNPWQPADVGAVVERHGPRKQRLVVSQLDRSRIAPEIMRAIKELLTRAPA